MSRKKEKVKIEFTIVFQQLRELPKYTLGANLYIECKRGKKPKSLKTSKTFTTRDPTANLNGERLTWEVSMFQNPKTKAWEPKKKIVFTLKEQHPGLKNGEKKGSELFAATLQLTEYASPGLIKTEIVKFGTPKDKIKANLVIKIEAKFLKVGDQQLVKAGSDVVASASNPVIQQGSDMYELKPANDVTESNLSMSDDESADRASGFPEDDEDSEEEPPPKPRPSASAPLNNNKTRSVTMHSPPEDNSAEIAALQQEVEDLRRDKDRAQKKADKLQSELADAREQIEELSEELETLQSSNGNNSKISKSTTLQGSPDDSSELKDLRQDKSRLEKKLEKTQAELNETKAQNQQLLQTLKEGQEGRKSSEDTPKRPLLRPFSIAGNLRTPSNANDKNASGGSTPSSFSEPAPMSNGGEKSERTEEIFETILKAINNNTISNTEAEADELVQWLAFTINLFKVLRHGTLNIAVDKKLLKKTLKSKDLSQLDTLNRFLHNLKSLCFEVYCALLHSIYKHLETSLYNNLESLSRSKDVFELPPILVTTIKSLNGTGMSSYVTEAVISQIFEYIDSQLFNTLLKKTNMYKCGFGFKLKMMISKLEAASNKCIKQHLDINFQCSDHLYFIKEAANLLVMDKTIMSDSDVRNQMFSHLNINQIAYFLKYFEPDEVAPDAIPNSVKKAVNDDAKRQGGTMQMDHLHIEQINLVANLL